MAFLMRPAVYCSDVRSAKARVFSKMRPLASLEVAASSQQQAADFIDRWQQITWENTQVRNPLSEMKRLSSENPKIFPSVSTKRTLMW
jgi:hypothetical protein